MPTTPKFTDSVGRTTLMISPSSCLSVSMKYRREWAPIVCSLTQPRLRSFGALPVVVSIRSRLRQSESPHFHSAGFLRQGSWRLPRLWRYYDYVKATVRSCFAAFRQIRSVRRSLSQHSLLTLLLSARLTTAAPCWPVSPQSSPEQITEAAARLIFYARRSEHVTPLLRDLHWLRVPERIQFRLCVLTFRCLHGSAPSYLANSLRRTVDVAGRQRLRSSDVTTLVVPSTRRSTFGDRAFPIAAPRTWNRLLHQSRPWRPYRRFVKN